MRIALGYPPNTFTYLIMDHPMREAAIVDPGDDQEVARAVEIFKVSLTKVLYTSFCFYNDQVYERLREKFKDLQFYGGDDRMKGLTRKVKHNDTFNVGELEFRCLAMTPTGEYISYYAAADRDTGPTVFTGDTLTIGGCGGFVSVEPSHLYKAFIEILGSLPDKTIIRCIIDTSILNRIDFAHCVEPENRAIRRKFKYTCESVVSKIFIVMGTIGEEKLTNPFMRVHEKSVKDYTGLNDPIEVMGFLQQKWINCC